MSNRFRNLKLGGTFKMQSNRLAPLPAEDDFAVDSTLKKTSDSISQVCVYQLSIIRSQRCS